MIALAGLLARKLWAAMLWLMRRRWIRRLQRMPLRFARPGRREIVKRRMLEHDRFARRYGLRLLTYAILAFLCSVALTVVYIAGYALLDAGLLRAPER